MWADFAGSTGLRGHTANWAKFNAYISYFGARTRSRATEVGYFFPMEGIWQDLNPGPLDSRGFRRGGLDVSGFRRIHWATGPHMLNCKLKKQKSNPRHGKEQTSLPRNSLYLLSHLSLFVRSQDIQLVIYSNGHKAAHLGVGWKVIKQQSTVQLTPLHGLQIQHM